LKVAFAEIVAEPGKMPAETTERLPAKTLSAVLAFEQIQKVVVEVVEATAANEEQTSDVELVHY
jgi:hypothetical protein